VTDRLVSTASRLLERRTSRRGVLIRLAIGGSALAVAPLRYLLRPGSAMAVITCRNCHPGALCCDGWTEFCCTINGGVNGCPPYTFMGGWWKCTNYTGTKLCSAQGVRYYIDCNRLPGRTCPHGCSCAEGSCHHRSTCCNVFRYGQCNTHVHKVTEVVCRMITCTNPGRLFPGQCSTHTLVDDLTCHHEAACLVHGASAPPYRGLGGGGGTL
jgi:hypothetical protein